MSTAPAPARQVPELALLERAVGYTRTALVAAVTADPALPTPCAAWTLGDLLVHMVDSLDVIASAGGAGVGPGAPPVWSARTAATTAWSGGPPPGLRAPRTGLGSTPSALAPLVGQAQERACAMLSEWSARDGEPLVDVAGSPLRAGLVAAAGALEITVHGWDVARTVDLDHPIPGALAEDLLAYLPLLVTRADRPHRFAHPVVVILDSAPATRLLAALGRTTTA